MPTTSTTSTTCTCPAAFRVTQSQTRPATHGPCHLDVMKLALPRCCLGLFYIGTMCTIVNMYMYIYIHIHTYPPFLTNIWGISPSRCQLSWCQAPRHVSAPSSAWARHRGPGRARWDLRGPNLRPRCLPAAGNPWEITRSHGKSMGKSMEYAAFIW